MKKIILFVYLLILFQEKEVFGQDFYSCKPHEICIDKDFKNIIIKIFSDKQLDTITLFNEIDIQSIFFETKCNELSNKDSINLPLQIPVGKITICYVSNAEAENSYHKLLAYTVLPAYSKFYGFVISGGVYITLKENKVEIFRTSLTDNKIINQKKLEKYISKNLHYYDKVVVIYSRQTIMK